MSAKAKPASKPMVFLSHSSSNRRELVALKRFLSERAGGMIDFFLSSDDDSISPGTIWPAEVRAALDRMELMLVFISPEALKSPWTYFEAGYGLHKLKSASIYCLPGTNKASLRSPFDLLQNRNLHSAKEISLLIHQINKQFSAQLQESATKADFDKIFSKSTLTEIEIGPRANELVEKIEVAAKGPPNSAELFASCCAQLGHAVSTAPPLQHGYEDWCSTGVRISIKRIPMRDLGREIPLTEESRKAGEVSVRVDRGVWTLADEEWDFTNPVSRSIEQIEEYNNAVSKRNAPLTKENEERAKLPRQCMFTLVPFELSAPIQIVDGWLAAASESASSVNIRLLPTVLRESQTERIGAKVHGSRLILQTDGTLLWLGRVIVDLCSRNAVPELHLTPVPNVRLCISEFEIEELLTTLCQLQIFSLQPKTKSHRKR